MKEMLDYVCWNLCTMREGLVPPEKHAETKLEGRDVDDIERARTTGEIWGMLYAIDDVVGTFEMYEIDVEGRAKLYADENGDDLDVPKTRDELMTMLTDD